MKPRIPPKPNGITDEEYREAACKRLGGMVDISICTEADVDYVKKIIPDSSQKVAKVRRHSIGAYVQAWVYVQNNWVEESNTYSEVDAKHFSVEGQNQRAFRQGVSAAKDISNFIENIKNGEKTDE